MRGGPGTLAHATWEPGGHAGGVPVAIYLTDGEGDVWVGQGTILERLPETAPFAPPAVIELTRRPSPDRGTASLPSRNLELSQAERRVLSHLPTNLTAPDIAAHLYLSVNTVKTHIRHIYAKLDAHNRTEAVDWARRLGLLDGRRLRATGPSDEAGPPDVIRGDGPHLAVQVIQLREHEGGTSNGRVAGQHG